MSQITESELDAITQYITELEAENDFLRRERTFQVGGAQALRNAAPEPAVWLAGPLPEGMGIGGSGQVVCLTHAAALAHSYCPEWFKPTPRKRARKVDGEG